MKKLILLLLMSISVTSMAWAEIVGSSCATAIPITVGSTTVGIGNYSQYYTITPTVSGYFKIYSPSRDIDVNVNTGTCDNLTYIAGDYSSLPFIVKLDANVSYILDIIGLYSDNLIVESVSALPKEFTSFSVEDPNYNIYNAIIDTVANKIIVNVGEDCDLTNLTCYFEKTADAYTSVSNGDVNITSSGVFDFSSISSLVITDDNLATATYSLIFNKLKGLSCASAIAVSEGVTTGIGFNSQFFTFTPTQTEFVNIYSTESFSLAVDTGSCGFTSVVESGWCSPNEPLLVKVEAGTKYTIEATGLGYNDLIISKVSSLPKEFTSFWVSASGSYYYATIDTVANSLVFRVPSDFDLTNLSYSFEKTSENYTTVRGGNVVMSNYGSFNFNSLSSVLITDANSATASYSVTFNKIAGLTCSAPIVASEGQNDGNGDYYQYFSFTPTQSEYVNISTTESYSYVYIGTGDCSSLSNLLDGWISSTSRSLFLRLEAGTKYTIRISNLYSGKLGINVVSNIAKEFTSFTIIDGTNNYPATIDTVANTLTFKVASDCNLSSISYSFLKTMDAYTKVSANGADLSYSGIIDFTSISSLNIADINAPSSISTYSVKFVKVPGITCGSAIPIADGSIIGNGYDKQYYSFTPAVTEYVKIAPSYEDINVSVYTGDCASQNFYASAYIIPTSPLIIKVTAGTKYTLAVSDLEYKRLKVTAITNLPKEFKSFAIIDTLGNTYYAAIDTIENTLSFAVGEDCYLGKLACVFEKTASAYTTVSANGVDLFSSNVLDFTNISTLQIKDDNAFTADYSVSIKKVAGLSCGSAISIAEGKTIGNGYSKQYYTYTPTQTEFVKIHPSANELNISILKGDCASFSTLYSDVVSSTTSPLVVKFESSVKYTIVVSNLYSNTLNMNKEASLAKEFTNFSVTDESINVYYAEIDTVANTLKFKVRANTNISKLNYNYNTAYNEYTIVSVNDSLIGNSGTLDFTRFTTIKLTDANSATASYSISFVSIFGTDCNSAVSITNDTTAGNGFYTQYFSYTSSKTGYIKIFSPESYFYIQVYTGDCGALNFKTSGGYDYSNPLIMKVESGVKYTLQLDGLNARNLVISEISDFPKEFRSFYISNNGGSNFSATIDTVANTLEFTVPNDFDLSKSSYSFECTSGDFVTVSANNSIIGSSGTLDLSNLTSLVITDKNAQTATYSLKIVRVSGLTCSSATPVSEGKFLGNGAYDQYFSFTPTQAEYVKIYSVDNYTYTTVRTGDCLNNVEVINGSSYYDSPLFFKAEGGVTYIIAVDGLRKGSMVINKVANIAKEFTYFNITDADGYNYNADIDTVANTLTFDVAPDCDISSLTYNFNRESRRNTTVSYNDTVISESGWLNFSKLTSLVITDMAGASATYSVIFKQVQGLSCGSAVSVSEGKTPGNGYYRQFFSFTPTKTGFIGISSLNFATDVNIFMGECGAFYNVVNQYVSPNSPLLFKAKTGTTYTFEIYGLYSDTLNLEGYTSLPKEFTSFQITDVEGNEYFANIDTVANKLTFTVASNCDLSSVVCYFNTTINRYANVLADGASFVNSNVYDFTKISSLVIADINAETATYTLAFNKLKGLSCSDALVAVKGSNAGNGASRQYFSFIPSKTEYLSFSPDSNYVDISIYTGSCDALSRVVSNWANSSNTLVYKVEAGVNYTIAVFELYAHKLNIETQNTIPKEFSYFSISNGNSYYSAHIDTFAKTLTFYVDSACDLSSMSYNFELRSKLYSSVSTNNVEIDSYGTLNFNNVQSFVITDVLSAKTTYTVIIKKVSSTDIMDFMLEGQLSSKINPTDKTISVVMPYKSDVSNLVAWFNVMNGSQVKIGSTIQHNGETANDYTNNVVYTVIGKDGITTQNWTVNVSTGKNTETLITAFNVEGQIGITQIDTTAKVINVVMPSGTDVKSLVATFSLSDGATAKVGTVQQASGTTANDYTNEVTFIVVAQDGVTTQSWKVVVQIATAIENTLDASIISVYPNPSNGVFNIKLDESINGSVKLSVFNTAGSVVLAKTVNNENVISLDLTNQPKGVYYLNISDGNNTASIKLIINK